MTLGADAWDLDEGITDHTAFLNALPQMLPEATHLEVEGSAIAPQVRALYRANRDGSRPLGPRQTIFSFRGSERFRCAVSPQFFSELVRLTAGRAHREVADHLSVYANQRVLLEWHDAFANALLLAPDLPEYRVREMARRFGIQYGRD